MAFRAPDKRLVGLVDGDMAKGFRLPVNSVYPGTSESMLGYGERPLSIAELEWGTLPDTADVISQHGAGDWWFYFHNQDYGVNAPFPGLPYHQGIDLNLASGAQADAGKPVFAPFNGTVRYGEDTGGYGNYVIIQFDTDVFTDALRPPEGHSVYAIFEHLSEIDEAIRSAVDASAAAATDGSPRIEANVSLDGRIGLIGDSGNQIYPHLHFQMYIAPSNNWDLPQGYYADPNVDRPLLHQETLQATEVDIQSIDPLAYIQQHSYSDNENNGIVANSNGDPLDESVFTPRLFTYFTPPADEHAAVEQSNSRFYGRLDDAVDVDAYQVQLEPGIYLFRVIGQSPFEFSSDEDQDGDGDNTAGDFVFQFLEDDTVTVRNFYVGSNADFVLKEIEVTEKASVSFSVRSFTGEMDDYAVLIGSVDSSEGIFAPLVEYKPQDPGTFETYGWFSGSFEGGGGTPVNQAPEFNLGQPDAPTAGDVYVGRIDRFEDLTVGETEVFSTNVLADGIGVYRLLAEDAGTLDVAVQLWGGSGATVSLAQDINRDGFIQAGEIIEQVNLASVASGALSLEETLAGAAERYVLVQSNAAAGSSSELRITAEFIASDGTATGAAGLPAPEPADLFTPAAPGSLADDGVARFGRINGPGDLDHFRTNLLEGGRTYEFRAFPTGSSALSDLRMFVYDSAGVQVGSASAAPGAVAELKIDIPAGQSQPNYTVEIRGGSGSTGSYFVAYEDVGAVPLADDHPDGTLTPLTTDTPEETYIGESGDVDSFTYTVEYGHQYTAFVTPFAGDAPPLTHARLTVIDPDGDQVVSKSVESASTFALQFTAYEAGDFTFELDALMGATGAANIAITDNGQVVYPAPTVSGATYEGQLPTQGTWDPISWTNGSFGPNGDVHKVFVSMGSEVTIYVEEVGIEFGSVDVAVYTESGEVVNPIYHGPTPDGHEFTLSSTPDLGVFFNALVMYSGSGVNTDFSYRIAAVATDDKPDEANELWTLGGNATVSGQIEQNDPGDVFRYTGPRGAVEFSVSEGLVAATSTWPKVSDAILEVFDEDGNTFGRELILDLDNESLLAFLPEGPDEYYVRISDATSEGYYLVDSANAPDDTAGDASSTDHLAVGGSVSGLLETYGDSDAFHVRLESGTDYQIARNASDPDRASGAYIALVDTATGVEYLRTDGNTLDFSAPGPFDGGYTDALVVIGHQRSANPNESSTYVGTYDLSLADVTSDDHGDTVQTATNIAPSDTVQAYLGNGDVDAFALSGLTAGQAYAVTLAGDPSADVPLLASMVELLAGDGSVQQSAASDDDGSLSLSFVAEGSLQTLLVSAFGEARVGGVTFSVDAANTAPLLAVGQAAVATEQDVEISALLTTYDPDADPITEVEYVLLSGMGGSLVAPDGTTGARVLASPDETVSFRSASDVGDALVGVRVFDGADWSNWQMMPVTVGATPVNGPTGTGPEFGETGTLTLTHAATTVTLQRTYENPVVIAYVATENGSQPVNVRVADISGNDLTLQLQEPSDLDGSHVQETVHYLVVEAGTWVLPDGTVLEAGTLNGTQLSPQGFDTVAFEAAFDAVPVILSQVQTFNGSDFVTTRQRGADAGGFQLTMQKEEANNAGAPAAETIGWVAIEAGSGTAGGVRWLAGSASGITHANATVHLGSDMADGVNVIAALSGFAGSDPSWVRGNGSTTSTFDLSVQEDTSRDAETAHVAEAVDYFAFDGHAVVGAYDYDLFL
ncbi:MAG: M23 family metallopeptidase [Rhodobacter sp.]|nr:M23 family metallopeptidase [Rhodobacter sp.]